MVVVMVQVIMAGSATVTADLAIIVVVLLIGAAIIVITGVIVAIVIVVGVEERDMQVLMMEVD
jgi:hypothetical protein